MEYISNIGKELENKYQEKEIAKMWNQLMWLSKVMAILGILVATHTMPVFALVVFAVICYTLYRVHNFK